MAYGHAERNLALIRQLEAETGQLLAGMEQQDAEQAAWLKESGLVLPPPQTAAELSPVRLDAHG